MVATIKVPTLVCSDFLMSISNCEVVVLTIRNDAVIW